MNERNIPPVISRSAEVAGKGVRFIAGKASEFAHDNPRATVTGLAEIAILIAGGKMIIDQATQEVIPSNYYEPPTIAAPENPTSQEILVTDEEFLTDLVEEVNSTFDLSQWVEGGEVYKPAGMCLQGVATRIEAIRPSFVGEIGNGSGVGLAIQAIDKLRNMPQFQTIELSNPPTIEQLRDFPDGTIIGMTPSQISIIDDARNKGVKYADAGHIFILMRNPENPDQLLSVSDGIWTVDRYLSEMSDSEMVAFLPVTKKLSSDNGLMYPMGSAVDGLLNTSRNIQEKVTLQQMREAAGIVEKVTGTLDQISIFSETEQSPYKLLVENVPHEAEIIQKAHDIMQLPPPSEADNRTGTDVKSQKEIAMFKDLQQKPHTGGDVLFALNVATTIHGREYGMDMLWEMIQRGDLKDAGLLPISEKQINWCLKHRLDPRTLAIAIYARTIAMDILKGSTLLENPQDGFFEALSSEQMQQRIENLDKLMPNVGIITALAGTETGSPPSLIPIEGVAIQDVNALVNIGSSPIYNQFNLSPGQYPSAPNNMNVLTQKWQNATKLPYYTYRYNLPGSQRGDGDDSGGAFSEQIMPSLKRAIAQKFETINAKLGYRYPNLGPLDPVSQLVSMNLYLSGEWYLRQGQPDGSDAIAYDAVKGGYIAGDIERMKKAIFGWNGKLDQRDLVIGLGVDYYNQIIAEINSTNP